MAKLNRRGFVQVASGATLAALAARSGSTVHAGQIEGLGSPRPLKRKRPSGLAEVRRALTGPLTSVATPFTHDGSIDFRSLAKIVDFAIAAGSRSIILTAGDSHYFCLSDDEIAQVTKAVCQQTAGRAMVVAADRNHSTRRAEDFAKYARGVGADVVMCLPPDWAGSTTPETLAEHYAAVGQHAPVMIVTGVFISRGVDFGLKTVKAALDRSPAVVAIKDDFCGEFARRLSLMAYDRCAIFSGGQKENHFDLWPYGCDGYLSSFATIAPEIARKYWSAIERKDTAAAREVIRDVDVPFFKYILGLQGGFDAGMHGVREIYGLGTRWRRKPYYTLNDHEMDGLRNFLATLKIPRPA